MFGASFGIVSQALEIYKKAIDIHNRNIMNANNPDYVEEQPSVKSFAPAGINLEDVIREQNLYYLNLRNSKLSTVRYLEERSNSLTNVEGMFQELFEGTGISDYTNRFFQAYENLMKNPTNEGAKNELYNSARALAGFIRNRRRDLDRLDNNINTSIEDVIRRINELTRKLYVLNKDLNVFYGQTYARGRDYKNVLDERDKYVRELSELINIQIQVDEIGRVKVVTSKGFTLVDFYDNYWQLEYRNEKVYWLPDYSNVGVDITDVIESGKLKALIDAKRDAKRFKDQLDQVAQYLISNVKLPRENSGTWYLVKNVDDPDTVLSTYGIDGTLEFYDNSTTPPTLIATIANYGSLSLNDLASQINSNPTLTSAGFSATVVNNPDGTYSILIQNTNPNYDVQDSGVNILESSPVFTGTNGGNIREVSTLADDMNDINYSLTDTFSGFGTTWWDEAKLKVNNLISDISNTQADVKDKLRIENALLESLNRKLQEIQGVSIDKEFMEIMKVKRTYEAVAKVVTTIDELIRTTLQM